MQRPCAARDTGAEQTTVAASGRKPRWRIRYSASRAHAVSNEPRASRVCMHDSGVKEDVALISYSTAQVLPAPGFWKIARTSTGARQACAAFEPHARA